MKQTESVIQKTLLPVLFLMALIMNSCRVQEEVKADQLEALRLNHPGLVTDLGVGLWAWPLPMDYDHDGDMDLVVSCPDKPFNGLYFFENTEGKGVKMPVFEPPVWIGFGKKHLQVSYTANGPTVLGRGVEFQDFRDSVLARPVTVYPRKELEDDFEKIRFSQWKYVDYENDGDLDLLVGIDEWGDYGWDDAYNEKGEWTNGPLHAHLFLLENENGSYTNKGKIMAGSQPLDVYGAPSPNMMDFDGDGDLDLICGEFLDRLSWFENTGNREQPVFAEGRFLSNENGILTMDLQMIIPAAIDWDGDGDEDLIIGDEDGRVAFVENTGQVQDHMPVFRDPVYFQQKADLVKFGALVTPCAVDWDADGDLDLICGNTAGYIGFIENLDGGNPPRWAPPVTLEAGGETFRIMAGLNGSIQGPAERKWGYTTLSVADWDMDGLHDVILNSIWGKILWLRNAGSEGAPVLEKARPVRVKNQETVPKPLWNWWDPEENELVTQWRTTPFATDWDGDGLTDLIMLDAEGYLCFFKRFRENGQLMLKPGERIFHSLNVSVFDNKNNIRDSVPGLLRLNEREAGGSGRVKFTMGDWDGDQDMDLLVNSLNVALFEQVRSSGDSCFFIHRGNLSDAVLSGHTTSPTLVNWDGEGLPDLLVGAEDGHFYYLENEH